MAVKKLVEWLGLSRDIKALPDRRATFLLLYDDLLVGTLSARGGRWMFEYSDEFRRRDALRPLVEFPDVTRTYESDELWQFFACRIPSTAQAEVGEILRDEHIDETDAVSLLKRFGRWTTANPFELKVAA